MTNSNMTIHGTVDDLAGTSKLSLADLELFRKTAPIPDRRFSKTLVRESQWYPGFSKSPKLGTPPPTGSRTQTTAAEKAKRQHGLGPGPEREAKRPRLEGGSNKGHTRAAELLYEDYVARGGLSGQDCLSRKAFEAALPQEFWASQTPTEITLRCLLPYLIAAECPGLSLSPSSNAAPPPPEATTQPSAVPNAHFLIWAIEEVRGYDAGAAILLRGAMEYVRSPEMKQEGLGIATPILKRNRDRLESQLSTAVGLRDEAQQGGGQGAEDVLKGLSGAIHHLGLRKAEFIRRMRAWNEEKKLGLSI